MSSYMKLSDRIAQILVEYGVTDIFMVTGGMAMHLNDSLTRNKNLSTTFFHHEQACVMAAEGYYKASGKIPVICVTAGPGGINALNGVFGSFGDSVPMLIISGQVRTDTLKSDKNLRQLGDQEAPITNMVKEITKYSRTILNSLNIEKDIYLAFKHMLNNRMGPVWLDIPVDIQSKKIFPKKIVKLNFKTKFSNQHNLDIKSLQKAIANAKRPLIIAGGGIMSKVTRKKFLKFVELLNIPVVTAFNGHDLLWENHKNFVGRCGTIGERRGNLVVECSDLILVLGSSLNIRQIGYNYKDFGKDKFFCYVDIDKSELNKKTIRNNIDLPINLDLDTFFDNFFNLHKVIKRPNHIEFLIWSQNIKNNYSVKNENFKSTEKINPYLFTLELSKMSNRKDVIVTSNATAAIVPHQAFLIKKGQKFFTNSTSGSMGYGICAAIGASISNKSKRIFCFEGDGSIQMNIQELATISYHRLNIILFIFSNNGYHSIRQTQNNYFSDNLVGLDNSNGISFPNLKWLSKSYGINFQEVNKSNVSVFLKNLDTIKLPTIVNIDVDQKIDFQPRIKSKTDSNGNLVSPKLYDMHPFLENNVLENIFKIKQK